MSTSVAGRRSHRASGPFILVLVGSLLGVVILPFGSLQARGETSVEHLVISEVVTGGASASDELIELYNPAPVALPLEGLELVYASASGISVSRRADWAAGAPEIPPGQHLLVANELGIYAPIADALYASGLAATGGSVALRIQGAGAAIDAVGWGSAASSWIEGRPAVAPAAGASIERLPGGALGSTQDTDDNLVDFVERLVPDPQNAGSPPTPDPSQPPPTSSPTPTATTSMPPPTSTPTPALTPSPGPDVVSVATARALPDGASVTIEATSLTASGFAEGGGHLADASGGIAVLASSGSFGRGSLLRVSGTVEDRFAQRTIRASESQISVLGPGTDPATLVTATGAIGEPVEGRLVRISGTIAGAPTLLSAGLAYDVDDGSGATRVIVGSATGIDTQAWASGSLVELVGVVGQRDSSGTGAAGYRVQPRDPGDVIDVGPPPSASPTPDASPSAGPSATPTPDGVISIAEARAAAKHARVRVRGTVTLPAGIVDPTSAVIQDETAAIVLRLAGEARHLARGDRVEVHGTRSTLAGMETLRVTTPAVRLGAGAEPDPAAVRTGDADESLEASLVAVRGAVVSAARRVASGTVSFEIDDGSGPLRVYVAAALGGDSTGLTAATWVSVDGVLGQETSGAQPLRGYRVWPRSAADVRVVAAPTDADAASGTEPGSPTSAGGGSPSSGEATGSLAGVGGPHLSGLRIGATLVEGPWPELGIGGLLWDGERLVGIADASAARVRDLLEGRRTPLALELSGLRATGTEPITGIPSVALGGGPGDLAVHDGMAAAPAVELGPGPEARWVSVVGRTVGSDRARLDVGGTFARLEVRCSDGGARPDGMVSVTGIGIGRPARIIVPCGGIRRAPVLGRAASALAMAGPVAGEAAPASSTFTPADDVSRVPAGLLLVAGAILLAAAAALHRRGGDEPEPDEDAGVNGPDVPSEEPQPRTLSLMSVPHDRRSP